ncbi:MAG: hypothetical protein K0U52_08690, partial [Gammaproteobacteria bacterium]|nr:hypothetical protein [Gammaproteobacteria bacterium]
SSTAGAGYINFGDSDDNNVGMIIYGHSSNSMDFWTNASKRMTIDSSGNVGINETNPDTKLHIKSSTYDDFIKLERDGIGAMGISATNPRGIQTTDGAGGFLGWHVNSSGNVGIGTFSPLKLLTVKKATSTTTIATSEVIRLAGTAQAVGNKNELGFANYDNNYNASVVIGAEIMSTAAYLKQDLYFATRDSTSDIAPTERMRITSGGNVGIGTTLPQSILSLSKTDEASYTPATAVDYSLMLGTRNGNAAGTSDDLGPGIVWKYNDSNGGYTKKSAGIMQVGEGNYLRSGLAFYTNNNADQTTVWSEKMRLSMDGNVGIGTTTPLAKLQVGAEQNSNATGISLAAGASVGNLIARTTTHHNWFPYTDGSNYYSADNHIIRNASHSTEWMRVNSSGNVGIGKTNLDAPLVVYRSGDVWHTVIGNDSGQLRIGGQTSGGAVIQSRTQSGTARDLYLQRDGGRVGIGLNSPPYKLTVADATNGWLAKFENAADENIAVYVSHGSGYGMAVDSTENDAKYLLKLAGGNGSGSGRGSQIRMLVESSGNVGIGTASPDANLEIKTLTGGAGVNTLRLNTNFAGGNAVDINPFITGINNGGMEIKLAGSQKLVMLPNGNVGIGTASPSGPFHVKVGTSTPLIVASSSYCNNVGIRTTTPTASLQVKGNVSYSYNNYTNVATTWINVINFSGYPAGLYQISIIKKTDASTYITAIVKWSGTAGTVVSTIASNQLGIGFNGSTILQAISGIATGTLMSANLQCLVTNEDFCS